MRRFFSLVLCKNAGKLCRGPPSARTMQLRFFADAQARYHQPFLSRTELMIDKRRNFARRISHQHVNQSFGLPSKITAESGKPTGRTMPTCFRKSPDTVAVVSDIKSESNRCMAGLGTSGLSQSKSW